MERSQPTEGSKYEDLSGIKTPSSPGDNPFDAMIDIANNDPEQIQARYETHRRARNDKQKARLLDKSFAGAEIDPILYKLLRKKEFPNFSDPRYCLVFWARPTEPVKTLIATVQEKLLEVLPNLWLMPLDNLHMTAMEIAHSLTEPEIESLVMKLAPRLEEITDFTFDHRTRLVRPLLGFDASALALSFVPTVASRQDHGDAVYTYHHLRRDLHNLCKSCGVEVGSRYVVPSAHLTIARFTSQADVEGKSGGMPNVDPEKMKAIVSQIDVINQWLQDNFWHEDERPRSDGSEWIVGQTKGLDCNKGTLWYGYSQRVRLGKGF